MDKLFNTAIVVIAFVVGLFHLLNVSGVFVLSTREVRIFHLVMMLALLFLTSPSLSRFENLLADKLARLALVAISVGCSIYILSRWKDIAMSGGETEPMDAWVGFVLILLVLIYI